MDRDIIVRETWRQINVIACRENAGAEQQIRAMVGELGIEPGMHVGRAPGEFTPLMTGEWVLGQWAAMIDAKSPFLNTARNISIDQYEKLYGRQAELDDLAGGAG